eukprot:CCRYP_008542-RE/>CCRYP_008542-RE protein AED:0.42 eAED:0.41 QI:0/0.75/0.6/1/0.75/0.6/5/593/485
MGPFRCQIVLDDGLMWGAGERNSQRHDVILSGSYALRSIRGMACVRYGMCEKEDELRFFFACRRLAFFGTDRLFAVVGCGLGFCHGSLATLLTLLAASDAFAPVTNVQHQRNHVVLSATRNDEKDSWNQMTGAAAAFVTGLSFMAQVAFADPASIAPVDSAASPQIESSSVVVSVGAPTFGGGGSFETLDFSLPSYDEAVGGDVSSKPSQKKEASDFLGGLTGTSSQNDEDSAAAKAAEKAAKEQADAEAKAAAQAAKEEAKRAAAEEKEAERAEKAAAEAKKQEEAQAQAAKEAEKEARKAAEREKQRQAAERQKAAREEGATPSINVPDIKDIKIPDMPKIEVPKVDMPKINAPKIEAPKVSAPVVDFKAPELPDVKLPSFSMPKVDMPKIDMPKTPSFDMPKIDMPKAPSFDMPQLDVPAAPSFNVPSKSSASVASFDAPAESQEARDARAAAKKVEFKEADSAAKASHTNITLIHRFFHAK